MTECRDVIAYVAEGPCHSERRKRAKHGFATEESHHLPKTSLRQEMTNVITTREEKTMTITKENNKEYTVIPAGEEKKDFTERMVLENTIPGLIPVSARELNGEASYYFDTTGRRVFSESFKNENDMLGVSDVEAICDSVIQVCRSTREYLLDIDDIDLKPETFYFNSETGLYEFIYIPGHCGGSGVKKLQNE